MTDSRHSRDPWLFWITALLVLGAGLGLRDPWPADEPRFALVAKQMVESGQWLFPMRGDEFYPDKPPLLMWLQAAFLSITGNLRIAFLLPSLLSALGALWLVRDLGTRLFSRDAGAWAAWALLFTLQFTFQSRRAQIDPLLVFCVTLSVYGMLRHLLRGPDRRWWVIGWCAAGLGVIAKGVGIIALLLLLPYAWARWKRWPDVQRVSGTEWSFGIGAFFLPILAWGVPMLLAVQSSSDPALHEYARNILFKQTGQRYAAAWHHHQPWWYFAGVIATQWLPTVIAVPWAWRHWRDALRARDARVLLPLAWIALVLLFFSISAGKREVYILPALPMLCVLLGPWLAEIAQHAWPRRIALACAILMGTAAIGIGAAMWLGAPAFEQKLALERDLDARTMQQLAGILVAIGMWAAASVFAFRRAPLIALASTLTGVWMLVGTAVMPLLNDSSSARGLMRVVETRMPRDAQLGLVAWKEQNLLMAQRPAATFGFMQPAQVQWQRALRWQQSSVQDRRVLIEAESMPSCVARDAAVRVGVANRRTWWLLPQSATRACDQSAP